MVVVVVVVLVFYALQQYDMTQGLVADSICFSSITIASQVMTVIRQAGGRVKERHHVYHTA